MTFSLTANTDNTPYLEAIVLQNLMRDVSYLSRDSLYMLSMGFSHSKTPKLFDAHRFYVADKLVEHTTSVLLGYADDLGDMAVSVWPQFSTVSQIQKAFFTTGEIIACRHIEDIKTGVSSDAKIIAVKRNAKIDRYIDSIEQAIEDGETLAKSHILAICESFKQGEPALPYEGDKDDYAKAMGTWHTLSYKQLKNSQASNQLTQLSNCMREVAREGLTAAFDRAAHQDRPLYYAGAVLSDMGISMAKTVNTRLSPVNSWKDLANREATHLLEAICNGLMDGKLRETVEQRYQQQQQLGGVSPWFKENYMKAAEPVASTFNSLIETINNNNSNASQVNNKIHPPIMHNSFSLH